MSQSATVVAVPDPPTPNPDFDPTGIITSPVIAADIVAALSNSGGSFPELIIIADPESALFGSATYILTTQLDTLIDPGINTGHSLKLTIKLRDFGNVQNTLLSIKLQAPAVSPTFELLWETQLIGISTWDGTLYSGPDLVAFTVIELPLSEAEVINFRANGGYTNCGVFIRLDSAIVGPPPDLSLVGNDYDFIELVCPTPVTPIVPVLELTQSGGIELSGGGQSEILQSGGYELDGGGLVYTNEFTQEGGIELGGGGVLGSNEIVQSGGYELSGGGRDGYFIAPEISGIYVLVPNKRDDTWYDRTSVIPAATIDVKIPDPFVSLAFLPED